MRKIPILCVAFRYISKRCEIVASAFPARLPGTRRRSWTSPRCSLCSRGNIARFRRRWYEMAETACVTEAQRLGYVEATHVFCDDPALLAWEETGLYPEEKGIKERFFFLTKKKEKKRKKKTSRKKNVRVVSPAGSERRLRVDTVGINRRGWARHMDFFFFLRDVFDAVLSTVWSGEWYKLMCVPHGTVNMCYYSVHGDHHSRQAQVWPNW